MTRILTVALLSLALSPAALACGMYIPEEVLLVDALEEIDSIEIVEVEDVVPVDELIVQEAIETEAGDALADADAEADVEVEVKTIKLTRRARRQLRKANR